MHEGRDDLDLLGHALGQGLHLAVGHVRQAKFLQHREAAPARLRGADALEAGKKGDDIDHLHLAVDAAFFRQEAHPVERSRSRLAAEQADRAAVGGENAQRHAQAGRLAGAIGAEKAGDLAALDPEADIPDRRLAAIGLRYIG